MFDKATIASVIESGFWFVDIPRTSSSSIRTELSNNFGGLFGKKNLLEKEFSVDNSWPDHIAARKVCKYIGTEVWDRLFTFSFVRNPWDRVFSMYGYRLRTGTIPGDWSFQQYVTNLYNHTMRLEESRYFKYQGFRLGASDYLQDDDGKIMVDFVGKYENRSRDLAYVAKEIGCVALDKLHLQSAKLKNHLYSDHYDSNTKKLVRKIYQNDVEVFNYEF